MRIGLCAVILTICSWITIPAVVPFTLGTFGVFFVTLFLDGKRGTICVLIYLLLGMVGVPVFSGFRGGISVLMSSTGGYVIGYLLIALIMWALEGWKSSKARILSMILGLLACYICGTLWFCFIYGPGAEKYGFLTAVGMCVLPFIIPDLLKIWLATFLNNKINLVLKGLKS